MNIAIFDLDGTLNTSTQRKHLIPARKDIRINSAWLPWHEAFKLETLCDPLIHQAAQMHAEGWTIFVVSNRTDSLGQATGNHLMASGFPPAHYVLRGTDDNRKPTAWKANTIAVLLATMEEGHVVFFDDDVDAIAEVANCLKSRTKINYDGVVVKHSTVQEKPQNGAGNHTIKEVCY